MCVNTKNLKEKLTNFNLISFSQSLLSTLLFTFLPYVELMPLSTKNFFGGQ